MVAEPRANSASAEKEPLFADSNRDHIPEENEVEVKETKAAVLKETKGEKKKKKKVKKDEDDYMDNEASYVGWKQVGGYENKDELTLEDSLDETHEQTLLNRVLPNAAYGEWYHSVALFGVASILSFAIGKFRFSLGPLFVVILVFSLYYRASIKKHRTSIKELVQKELVVQKVEDDYESIEWLNTLLDKFWIRVEPQVSQMVVEQVNAILATPGTIPVPLVKKLWIDEFSLGIKPPRIERVKTFGNTANDVVVMDWNLSFTPHNTTDLSAKQLKNYVNTKVVVKAFVGQKFVAIPVASISDISFSIPVRLRFKLMTSFPHMQTLNVQLLDVPELDLEAKLLNNSFLGWDLPWFIPGLLPFFKTVIKRYAGPILMPPFSFQLNIPQLLQGGDTIPGVGVLEVTLRKATDIKRSSKLDTSVDPYVNLMFGGALSSDKILAKSSTVRDTLNPVWDETLFLIVDNLTDPLIIDVMDLTEGHKTKDLKIGRVMFDMNTLFATADESSGASKDIFKNGINTPIVRNAKSIGNLHFDLKFHSVVQKAIVPDVGEQGLIEDDSDFEELNTGISSFSVQEGELNFTFKSDDEGKDDDDSDSECECEISDEAANKKHEDKRAKPLSLFVEVYRNGKLAHTTSTAKGTQYPKYGSSERFIVDNKTKTRFKFVVKNGTPKKNIIVASTIQSLSELIDRTSIKKTWISLVLKDKTLDILDMKLEIKAGWKSVNLYSNSLNATTISYQSPIGVIRTFINKANNLKDVETIGTIDPYACVQLNGKPVGRTNTIENTTSPIWNQAIYIPVNSPNQICSLEVFDSESSGKDRSIGVSQLKIDETLISKEANSDKWVQKIITDPKKVTLVARPKRSAFSSKKKTNNKFSLKKRGEVTCYESFYPCLSILSLEEIQEVDALNDRATKFKEKYAHIDLEKGISDKEEREAIKAEEFEISELQDLYSHKLKLDLDELLTYNSGVLAITVLSGEVASPNTYIQTFFDESGYSRKTSHQLNARAIKNPYFFDEFIKELEWSVTTFRVVKKPNNNKADEFISELVIPTMEIVKNCYYKPGILTLTGSGTSKLMIQAEWFPVITSKLPQSDLITNFGELKVTVKNATNVPISDANGFSDPFVKLYLNSGGEKSNMLAKSLMNKKNGAFLKTKTIKKNLNPVWNETGSVQVGNRVNDYLTLKLFDEDLASGDDILGEAIFPLSHIDPDSTSGNEFAIDIIDADTGKKTKTVVNVSFQFEPKFILSVEKKANNIASKGLSTGISTVGTAVGSVGKLKKNLFGKK